MDRIHWATNHSSSSHDMNIWNNEEASKESTPEASSLFLFALFEFFFELSTRYAELDGALEVLFGEPLVAFF